VEPSSAHKAMFTGLIESTGAVTAREPAGPEMDLAVDLAGLARMPGIGDSIALSGVCCTVVRLEGRVGWFRLSAETLRRTWLGRAGRGRVLNLESALRAGDPMGGHVVQGHVDGVAEVVGAIDPVDGGELVLRLPAALLAYVVEKGSVAVDGVSLTVAALDGDRTAIAVIPHTAAVTTLGSAALGQQAHIEVDVLAKYVERLLERRGWVRTAPPGH